MKNDVFHVEGAQCDEVWLRPRVNPQVDPGVMEALQAAAVVPARTEVERAEVAYDISQFDNMARAGRALSDWLPHLLWIMMPLHALGVALFFGWKRMMAEHLAFAMWAHATLFGFMTLLVIANRIGARIDIDWVYLPYLIYFIVAARTYYKQSWFGAIWKSTAHIVLYFCLIIAPVVIVVMAFSMDWSVYGRLFMAQMNTP